MRHVILISCGRRIYTKCRMNENTDVLFNRGIHLQMIRFLTGVATGWMLARAPPTPSEVKGWVDQVYAFFQGLVPKED